MICSSVDAPAPGAPTSAVCVLFGKVAVMSCSLSSRETFSSTTSSTKRFYLCDLCVLCGEKPLTTENTESTELRLWSLHRPLIRALDAIDLVAHAIPLLIVQNAAHLD